MGWGGEEHAENPSGPSEATFGAAANRCITMRNGRWRGLEDEVSQLLFLGQNPFSQGRGAWHQHLELQLRQAWPPRQ